MSVTVFIGHKIREKEYKRLVDMYKERISPYISLKVEYSPFASQNDNCLSALNYEESRYLKMMSNYNYTVVMDLKGEKMDSDEFSNFLNNLINYKGKVLFLIGGSCGFSDNVKKKADKLLSFSELTFPYQLFSVMFLEQFYRAITIIKGKRYHK